MRSWRYESSAFSCRWTCHALLHRCPWQAMHVWTYIVLYANFSVADLLQNLVGKHPKPFNDFFKIGYAPAELNINLSSESESGIFRLTAFRQIRFFLISVDCHLTKVSAHILYPKLCHPRLYQSLLFFIYKELYLYRSFAISVIWHRCLLHS